MTKISLSDIALFMLRGVSDFYAPHLPPFEPIEPAEPLSQTIKGGHAPG